MSKLIILIACLAALIYPAPALAKVMLQEQGSLVIAQTETIDDDLFLGAENIDLNGTVTGSVYAGAGMVNIKGNIKGDLVLGTGQANLSGTIAGDLYVGGGDVNLTGAIIGGSVIAGAGNLTIDQDSKIGGSLIAGTGNLRNSAPIGRSVMAGAGSIYLNNTVGKEVRLGGGQIELGPRAAIRGDFTYALGEESSTLKQDPAATIAGTVSRYTPPAEARRDIAKARDDFGKFGRVAHGGWLLVSFLGSLLVGFLLLRLFPKTSLGLANQVRTHVMPSLGIGFLLVVAFVPVLLVLALTIIGLPLAGLLLLVFCLELHLAKLASAYALGRFIATQFSWSKLGVYAVFFLGLAVFYLLRAIPVIGWVTSILFTWTGLGALWLYTRAHLKSL